VGGGKRERERSKWCIFRTLFIVAIYHE
jgi:hypothetical protein